MRKSSVVGWVVLAIAGLAVAAGVSLAASRLSSQRIGLASEPLSAGNRLAPATTPRPSTTTTTTPSDSTPSTPSTTPATPPSTTPATPPSTTPATPTDGGRGRGNDGDADDD